MFGWRGYAHAQITSSGYHSVSADGLTVAYVQTAYPQIIRKLQTSYGHLPTAQFSGRVSLSQQTTAISPDGALLYVIGKNSNSKYVGQLFKRNEAGVYISVTNAAAANYVTGNSRTAFAPNGQYLVFTGSATVQSVVYYAQALSIDASGNVSTTAVNFSTGVVAAHCAVSADSQYICLNHDATETTPTISFHKYNGSAMSTIPCSTNVLGATAPNISAIASHPTRNLFVATDAARGLVPYIIADDYAYAGARLPLGPAIAGLAFSRDGAFLYASLESAPWLAVYQVTGAHLARIPLAESVVLKQAQFVPIASGNVIMINADGWYAARVEIDNGVYIRNYAEQDRALWRGVPALATLSAAAGNMAKAITMPILDQAL
jgi:hypothetical protein